ncbi:hypothetical protein WN093_03595 [Gammaproteobacteria bacterium AS21]
MLYLKIILIALMLFLHNVTQASNQLVFSTGYFFIFEKGKNIVSQIYQKLDYDIVIKQYPDKRALKMSNNGEVDGELLRIKGMQQYYPNLRMVPTAIDQLDAQALAIDLDVEMNDWQDLKPYKIGIINGIKYAQIGTLGMQVHPVNTYQELFDLLERKRVDVIVCTKFACDYELKKLQDNNIKSLGVVQRIPLYHYLHRKHEKLIPLLNAKIIQMHKED